MAKFPALIPIEAARSAPIPPGRRSPEMMRHGSLEARFYAPRGSDPQTPHDQDEIYIVHTGSGRFRKGDDVRPFGPGDVIFVEAGAVHRFEDFTSDFAAWAVFWGPEGGEG